MGQIANAASKLGSTGTKGIGHGIVSPFKQVAKPNQFRQYSQNLAQGSKACPIINELNGIHEGIAQGDIGKVAINGAVLALSTQTASSLKVTALTNNNTFIKAGLLSSSTQICKRNFVDDAFDRSKPLVLAPEFQHLQLPKEPIRIMEKIQGMEFTKLLDEAMDMDNKHKALTYIGILNWSKMAAANLVFPLRDVPLTKDHYSNEDESLIIIRIGQMKKDGDEVRLEGVGRKMTITDTYDEFLEGQFEHKKLHGFGRQLTIHDNNEFEVHIGWWDKGVPHGYGRHLWRSGQISEGLYDQGQFLKEAHPQFMRTYDDDMLIAQEIDWNDIAKGHK